MSSKRSILVSGAVAAVIAIVLISAVIAAGVLNTRSIVSTSTVTSVSGVTSTVTVLSSNPNGSTQTQSGSGTLAVLMTDPPSIPNGTTAIYVAYNNLAVHVAGEGNNSGWYSLNSQGSIDLMKIVNVSQTIASTDIPSGSFNALVFNITSAIVTFNDKNYSAYLVYRQHTLFVPIVGGISITNGQISAAVIDLTPTVLLLGDPSNPSFAFIPAAHGYTIPAHSISLSRVRTIGQTVNVQNQSWFADNQPSFNISGTLLTPTKLSITVTNTGNSSLDFSLAAVTMITVTAVGTVKTLPELAAISEFFVVYPNRTLVPVRSGEGLDLAQMIVGSGYRLPPGASVTFTYTGLITIGLVRVTATAITHVVLPGQPYLISILASNKLSQTVVNATGIFVGTTSSTSG